MSQERNDVFVPEHKNINRKEKNKVKIEQQPVIRESLFDVRSASPL